MDVDLVANRPSPLLPSAHSRQHDTPPLASEFRTARIVRWGISATCPKDPHLRVAQLVGVKELERWPNNWRLVKRRSPTFSRGIP